MKAVLLLEDGTVYEGRSFGARGEVAGEVVFNTGMTGYQEILTDPSYQDQMVTMTYPLIGNYGINDEDAESDIPRVKGLIIRESCPVPSNFRSSMTLEQYLVRHGVIGIEDLDTRALVKRLREKGTMKGVIQSGPEIDLDRAAGLIRVFVMKDPVDQVTCSRVIRYVPHEYQLDNRTGKDLAQYPAQDAGNTVHQPLRVGLLDYGLKHNILRHLLKRGCQVTRFPARTTAEEIIKADLDGIMLSNGPGDPKDCESSIQTIRELWGRLPIFGICLGHQLTALSQGADTGRLKYGHRGANHPVKDLTTGRTYITSQNHGYAVLPESLDKNRIRITHINMNDGTVEGLKFLDAPVFTVQFHPEACPGPQDTAYLFDRFIASMRGTLPNAKT